ncbi:MAG TPA: TetR/AcrR family transcriptional regulator [Solirubrobacterales bacterium]|nr:TetR/AcrR family transcriptional regulator [Solirubrobacterales bacterium]
MSPRVADQDVRDGLLEAGARLLAREGPAALTTRRLAAETGTSTMAVYTHFGGMDGLRQAVRAEGFTRLTGYFEIVETTDDPVSDLSAMGWAYCFNAVANPQLYRAVFLEPPIGEEDVALGRAAVQRPIDTIARCIEVGRFDPAEPESLAVQVWVAGHGMITGLLAHLLTLDEVIESFSAMGRNLFVGFGDDPGKARRSIESAQERMRDQAPSAD